MTETKVQGPLPPPWDRIFSLGTRTFVWVLFFSILYVLRPFFLLVFLTFVFAYVLAHGVDGLAHRIASRTARVILVSLVLLVAMLAIGIFVVPQVTEQADLVYRNREAYVAEIDGVIVDMREKLPFIPKELNANMLLNDLVGLGDEPRDADGNVPPGDRVHQWLVKLRDIGFGLLGIGSAFLLSLLFSFLIVLDLPNLSRAVRGLRDTKLGFIYEEVAGNIFHFGMVLGRALEAQLFIAVANTVLTAIGLWAMGIEKIVFLSTIVFFCSFIPVVGVFISSAPICLMALNQYGVNMMVVAIVMIFVIHFIEAYFLNPKIFGHHLHMNPVLVLIVLTIAGKLFGIWGLVLGLPIVNYVFAHAIRYGGPDAKPALITP